MKKKTYSYLMGLFLMACTNSELSLSGKEFKMLESPDNAEITIGFEKNSFYGVSAVNRYMGTYEINGNNITFNMGGSTMMMGPLNLMDVESDYLKFLSHVKNYDLENDHLMLSDGNKTIKYEMMKK